MNAPKLNPLDLDGQVAAARRLIARKSYRQAIEILRSVLALDPDHPIAHASLAMALLPMGRLWAAGHEAVRALTCDPDCFEANEAMAQVRFEQQRYDDALQHLTWCLDHRSGYAPSLGLLGRLRWAQGRTADARRVFEEALSADPDDVDTIVELGRLAFEEGRLEEAAARTEEALRKSPDHAEGAVLMGYMHLQRGSVDGARSFAAKVLRHDRAHVGALRLLGDARRQERVWDGLLFNMNAWFGSFGSQRSLICLAIGFMGFALLRLVLTDLGQTDIRWAVDILWVSTVAASWAGPAWFQRSLDAQISQAELHRESR